MYMYIYMYSVCMHMNQIKSHTSDKYEIVNIPCCPTSEV